MISLLKNIKKEYEKYEENRAKLNDWIMTNDRIKDEAKENFKNTDYAERTPVFRLLSTQCPTKTR